MRYTRKQMEISQDCREKDLKMANSEFTGYLLLFLTSRDMIFVGKIRFWWKEWDLVWPFNLSRTGHKFVNFRVFFVWRIFRGCYYEDVKKDNSILGNAKKFALDWESLQPGTFSVTFLTLNYLMELSIHWSGDQQDRKCGQQDHYSWLRTNR